MKYSILLFLLVITSSCSVKVHSRRDQLADFSQYKSFCWLKGCEFTYTGPEYLNDSLLRERIKSAIVAEMGEKGLVKDDNDPDLLLDFHISVENESSIIYHRQDEYEFKFRPFPEEEVVNYLKGTVVIDMVDKRAGKMVWRSEAIGYMDQFPDLSEKNIRRGIALALKKFPPEPK